MSNKLSNALSEITDAVRWFVVIPIGLLLYPMAIQATVSLLFFLVAAIGVLQ